MVTIFTTPKPFKGHSAVIQHNALKSWTLLRPTPQIILFGNEEGSAQIAAELNLIHVTDVERSGIGTPLVSSMFGLAHRLSSNSLLCYVNADIMLTSQFVEALRVIHAVEPRFLMTGGEPIWTWKSHGISVIQAGKPSFTSALRLTE